MHRIRHILERKSQEDTAAMHCGLIELKLAPPKENDTAAEMKFSGYGAVFGNVDSYGDVIQKGAFKETLVRAKASGNWPAMLLQHGGGFLGTDMTPIGIWTDMQEDDHGLYVEGKLAPTPRGREIYELLKMTPRPAISGLSIGYLAKEWQVRTRPEEPRRTLKAVELVEVSLVTMPANPKARVANVKSDLTERDAEKALRDAGFPVNAAKAIVAGGFKAQPTQRDVGGTSELSAQALNDLVASAQRALSSFTSNS